MRRIIRSERVKLPRVHRATIGGTVYKYHRKTRAPLPNDVPEDHPRFISAWTAEEAKTGPKVERGDAGTLAREIHLFRQSSVLRDLSPGYSRRIEADAQAIADLYGKAKPHAIRRKHIEADLDKLDANPSRQRLKAWRLICAHMAKRGSIEANPCDGIKMRPEKIKAGGHAPWTVSAVEAYRQRWPVGTSARLCMELLYWTAARVSDAVRLSQSMVGDDGVLRYTQQKTGGAAQVPWTCALPSWAIGFEQDRDYLRQCLKPGRFTYLEAHGRVRSVKGLGNTVAAAAREAGLDLTAHGLRKARLTRIAEAGGSVHVIMAWGGHESLAEAQEYIATADRSRVLIGEEQERNTVKLLDHRVK